MFEFVNISLQKVFLCIFNDRFFSGFYYLRTGFSFGPFLSVGKMQAEVENQELMIEQSPNGYTSMYANLAFTKIILNDSLFLFCSLQWLIIFFLHMVDAKTEAPTVCVRFQLQRECSFGQNFLIVGEDPMFGLWDPNNAIPLTWSDGHLWTVDLVSSMHFAR